MADPISIITSATSAATIALKVSKNINQLITAVGDAPDDVQALHAEVDSVHSAIVHIHGILEDQTGLWMPTWGHDMESALDRSGDTLIKIQQLVSKWNGWGNAGKTAQTWKAFKWTFKDSEVARLTKRIEACKTALLLLVGAMSLASNGRIDQQVNKVHDRIQSLIAERIVDNEKSAERYARLGFHDGPPARTTPVMPDLSHGGENARSSYNPVDSIRAGPSAPRLPEGTVYQLVDRARDYEKDQHLTELQAESTQLDGAIRQQLDSKDEQIVNILGKLRRLEIRAAQQSESAPSNIATQQKRPSWDEHKLRLQQLLTQGESESFGSSTQELAKNHSETLALQRQVDTWKNKYEALAKLYSQLRQEDLGILHDLKDIKLVVALQKKELAKNHSETLALQSQVDTWKNKYEPLAELYSQLRQEHLRILLVLKDIKLKVALQKNELVSKTEKNILLQKELIQAARERGGNLQLQLDSLGSDSDSDSDSDEER